ncbi:MAG: hypothetical protein ABG776_14560 [Cyanobacteria bacterium J06555_13]
MAGIKIKSKPTKKKKVSPGQIKPWNDWTPAMNEVPEVAKKFVMANCFNADIAATKFATCDLILVPGIESLKRLQ